MAPPRVPSGWRLQAIAAAWLAAGWIHLAPGSAHPGVPYRPWAFDHHSYSDLLAMGGDRYFAGGRPTPYLEDRLEYPPLLGLALWLPSFVSRTPLGYFTVGYLFLSLCGLAAVAALQRIRGASAWWLAATPALAYYGGLNWDLLPIALLVAAVLALERGHAGRCGALIALGASAKLWPIAAVPPALGVLARRGARTAIARGVVGWLAAAAAANGPLLLLAPAGWAWFWRFNAGRGAENSIWEVLRLRQSWAHLAADARFLNVATTLPLLATVAFVGWAAGSGRAGPAPAAAAPTAGWSWVAGRDDRLLRAGTALVVVAWIATSKVWSPQYALWAFAAGALAAAPAWLFGLHAVLAAVDYHVAFEARSTRGLILRLDPVYTAEEVVRAVAYLALAAWIAREVWRAARRPAAPGTGAA